MENYMEHHGVQGQKWGVRRYQNEDGSLTKEGRKRLGMMSKKTATAVVNAKQAHNKASRHYVYNYIPGVAQVKGVYDLHKNASEHGASVGGQIAYGVGNLLTVGSLGVAAGIVKNTRTLNTTSAEFKKCYEAGKSEINKALGSNFMNTSARVVYKAAKSDTKE